MKKSEPSLKKVWEKNNLLRLQIILYYLRENPGSTPYRIALDTIGDISKNTHIQDYLNILEREILVSCKKVKYGGPYGYKKEYSITTEGLKHLESYKQDILVFLNLI